MVLGEQGELAGGPAQGAAALTMRREGEADVLGLVKEKRSFYSSLSPTYTYAKDPLLCVCLLHSL